MINFLKIIWKYLIVAGFVILFGLIGFLASNFLWLIISYFLTFLYNSNTSDLVHSISGFIVKSDYSETIENIFVGLVTIVFAFGYFFREKEN